MTNLIQSLLDFFSLNGNYKLENLLAKVEKILTFLSMAFFNLEKMIHYLVIIARL